MRTEIDVRQDVLPDVQQVLEAIGEYMDRETSSVDAPATRAEVAMVRYLRKIAEGRGAFDMSPSAYLEAVRAGWLSPAAADALRMERASTVHELESLMDEIPDVRARIARMQDEIDMLKRTVEEREEQMRLLQASHRTLSQFRPLMNIDAWCTPTRRCFPTGGGY